MKKNILIPVIAGVAGLVIMFLAAYFVFVGSDYDKMLKYVGSDNLVTITGDSRTVLENAGCKITNKGIELSETLEKLTHDNMSKRERSQVETILEIRGIDLSKALFTVSKDGENMLVILKLANSKEFVNWMHDLNDDLDIEKSVDGFDVYEIGYNSYMLIKGGFAYILSAETTSEAVRKLDKMETRASANKLAGWQKSLLVNDKTANVLMAMKPLSDIGGLDTDIFGIAYDAKKMRNGYMYMQGDLKGSSCDVTMRVYDKEGNALKSKILGGKVDMSLLSYASKDDVVASIVSISSDNEVIESAEQMLKQVSRGSEGVIAKKCIEVLKNIDGSIMFAGGTTTAFLDAIERVDKNADMTGFRGVYVMQMKPGYASKFLSWVKSQLPAADNLKIEEIAANTLKLTFYDRVYNQKAFFDYDSVAVTDTTGYFSQPQYTLKQVCEIYLKVDGNNFVTSISEAPTKSDGFKLPANVSKDNSAFMAINIPANKDLGKGVKFDFGLEGSLIYTNDDIKAKLVLTDTDEPLIATLISAIAKFAK